MPTKKDWYAKVYQIEDKNRNNVIDGEDFFRWYGNLNSVEQTQFGTYLGL
jgi:hypothetical protein